MRFLCVLSVLAGLSACAAPDSTTPERPPRPGQPGGGGGGGGGDLDDTGSTEDTDREDSEEPEANPNADDDGDGWTNGEEWDQNTDDSDPDDHPYAGGYDIDDCRWEVSGEGNNEGQVVDNFKLTDQHGEQVRLYDFCDQVVVVVSSAGWCGPCQSEARWLAGLEDKYGDRGLRIVTLLAEDSSGQTPNQSDLQGWASMAGFDAQPVLADTNWSISSRFERDGYIPTVSLLAPGLELVEKDGDVSENDIKAVLPD